MTSPGEYRHYKGGAYVVLGVATHTKTNERLVVYRSESGALWARDEAEFNSEVQAGEFTAPRFKYTGEDESGVPGGH